MSYYAPKGNYAVNTQYFAAGDVVQGPLVGVGNSASVKNGLYRYATGGGFPTSSFNASNYCVDIVFSPTGG